MTNQRKNDGLEEQKDKKCIAKERIEELLDRQSFSEIASYGSDGVICGYGTVNSRPICVYSMNNLVLSGAVTVRNISKICDVLDVAIKIGAPVVGFWDSKGVKLDEGLQVAKKISELIAKQVSVSGVIPQISAVMGDTQGINTYSLIMSDFVFAVKDKVKLSTASFRQVKTSDETLSEESFGSVSFNAEESGTVQIVSKDEKECIEKIRKMISFLPDNNLTDPDIYEGDDINRLCPKFNSILNNKYKVKDIISEIADNNEILEISENFADNIITGFIRLGGRTAGIVANEILNTHGELDVLALQKAKKFIAFCDAFNIPIVTFVDSEGYVKSAEEEKNGIMRFGAGLFYAYAEATVPKINVIINKAIGTSAVAMGNIGKDVTFSWPNAEISLVNSLAGASILYNDVNKKEKYVKEFSSPEQAVLNGIVDEVIEPSQTRKKLINAIYMFSAKRENRPVKKHGSNL